MKETIQLLSTSVAIAIPLVTGFIMLYGNAIGRLWDFHENKVLSWPIVGITYLLSLFSLTFFIGVLRYCVKASKNIPHQGPFRLLDQGGLIDLAETYFNFGYLFFLGSVALSVIQFIRIVKIKSDNRTAEK